MLTWRVNRMYSRWPVWRPSPCHNLQRWSEGISLQAPRRPAWHCWQHSFVVVYLQKQHTGKVSTDYRSKLSWLTISWSLCPLLSNRWTRPYARPYGLSEPGQSPTLGYNPRNSNHTHKQSSEMSAQTFARKNVYDSLGETGQCGEFGKLQCSQRSNLKKGCQVKGAMTVIVPFFSPPTIAGLRTTVFPAAKQGLIFHDNIIRG